MLIGQVSELTGATRKAIRYYESIGLIMAPKRQGSYRIFTDNDVMVISMIRRAQAFGFSLEELKDIVAKKTADKFPIELACTLIDNKLLDIAEEMKALKRQAKELSQFQQNLIEKFA